MDLNPFSHLCRAFFSLTETEENTSVLHGVITLVIMWSLYGALLTYSPIFHSWSGFTHYPVGNTTTYTSTHRGNLDL